MGNFIQYKDINVNNNINTSKNKSFSHIINKRFYTPNKMFISYNIIDKENNIILGIWNNPDKSNTLSNQGICIGNQEKINKLIFAIWHRSMDIVIMMFENNIKLKIYKETNKFKYSLSINNYEQFTSDIHFKVLKELKKINTEDSEHIDLIFSLIYN